MKEMNHPINYIWDHFKTILEESIKRNVPIKTTRKKYGCPWITSDIKKLTRKRDRWYKRSRKSGHSGDNKKFKDRKCTTQKEIGRAYCKYIDGIMSSETR
jgi:CRISPR/Cas system Type II protein with McrA/HNH and RuvC-like nuclease domain